MSFYLVGESAPIGSALVPEWWLTPDGTNSPHTANRICRQAGWTVQQFLAVFSHRTFLWKSASRLWAAEGKDKARAVKIETKKLNLLGIVLIGSRVASCFDVPTMTYFKWTQIDTIRVSVVPHPSGRAKAWKTEGLRDEAETFFDSLLSSTK